MDNLILPENTQPSTQVANSNMDLRRIELEAIKEKASIPDKDGITGEVLKQLQARMGKSGVDVKEIAMDMHLPKRTFQRHLQRQGVNFIALRNTVRLNYSITYLLETDMNIREISIALGFTDRTSFTNAFRRWTDITPNKFRKLYSEKKPKSNNDNEQTENVEPE